MADGPVRGAASRAAVASEGGLGVAVASGPVGGMGRVSGGGGGVWVGGGREGEGALRPDGQPQRGSDVEVHDGAGGVQQLQQALPGRAQAQAQSRRQQQQQQHSERLLSRAKDCATQGQGQHPTISAGHAQKAQKGSHKARSSSKQGGSLVRVHVGERGLHQHQAPLAARRKRPQLAQRAQRSLQARRKRTRE